MRITATQQISLYPPVWRVRLEVSGVEARDILLTDRTLVSLIATKLKANTGIKETDIPRNFRHGLVKAYQDGLLKIRGEFLKSGRPRYVLSELGKLCLTAAVNHIKNDEVAPIPIVGLVGNIPRKTFYKILHFVIDHYKVKPSFKFAPIDRAAMARLYVNEVKKANGPAREN